MCSYHKVYIGTLLSLYIYIDTSFILYIVHKIVRDFYYYIETTKTTKLILAISYNNNNIGYAHTLEVHLILPFLPFQDSIVFSFPV